VAHRIGRCVDDCITLPFFVSTVTVIILNLAAHSGASARERARLYEQMSSGPSSGPMSDSKPSHAYDGLTSDEGLVDESSSSCNKAKLLLKAKKKAEKEAQKAFEEQARLELER